jgi:PEP-CTERM motif
MAFDDPLDVSSDPIEVVESGDNFATTEADSSPVGAADSVAAGVPEPASLALFGSALIGLDNSPCCSPSSRLHS